MDQSRLRSIADQHQSIIATLIHSRFVQIQIFADGITQVGGRNAVSALVNENLSGVTDILLDISALSTGVIFPLARMLLSRCEQIAAAGQSINFHLFTVESPRVDHRIKGIPSESVSWMHGYRGDGSLESSASKAILWLPTLAPGAQHTLRKIYNALSTIPTIPIDVCPIVPFPGHDPKLPDNLVFEFKDEIIRWHTDYRNLLFAAESDPLDAYRTICSIHTNRQQIFEPLGGSMLVLSPVGNKLLAVGAMLAAIDRDLPVYMVESVGYDEDAAEVPLQTELHPTINTIWLFGEAYGECKPLTAIS